MRAITITDVDATTSDEARALLKAAFGDDDRFLVTNDAGERHEFALDGAIDDAPDPLTLVQGIFPRDGEYQITPAFAKAVNVTEPFAEWFLEQLLEEARKYLGKQQTIVLRVLDQLIRERAGHLTDPAVLAEFEHARYVLRQGVRWGLGAPIPDGIEKTLARLGFGEVGVLDWPGIAYRLGAINDELARPRDWQRVMAFATAGPVNAVDRAQMAAARERTARYLTPVVLRSGEVMVEAALAREARQLRTMTVQAIANDIHPLKLAREFHGRFDPEGIERDWERLARTEIMEARLVGAFTAEAAAKAWTGESKIWRSIAQTACNGCIKLYRNADGTPKIYTVAAVEAADALGMNRGPWRDWHARKGPAHPSCRDGPWQTWSAALAPTFARHAERWGTIMRERGLTDAA